MSNFIQALNDNPFILTDGGIETRIKYETNIVLPKEIEAAGLIYSENGRRVLTEIYNDYLDIAQQYDLPIIILTPTFRANPHRATKANVSLDELLKSAVEFHLDLKKHRGEYNKNIFIGGVIGPMNDAFDPSLALTVDASYHYHKEQINIFKKTAIDFLFAGTFPSVNEALGICMVMAEQDLPYVISFVLNHEGNILDGCSLNEAIELIDKKTSHKPLFYSINCIHPTIAIQALCKLNIKGRLLGLKANASSKSTEELQALTYQDQGEPNKFACQMLEINKQFGLKVLGGCCGTGKKHLNQLARLIRCQV